MSRNKMISLIGLAMKAGKIVSGEFMTEKSVKTGKAELVLVAADASDNTRKKFQNMCAFYEVPVFFRREQRCAGQSHRQGVPGQYGCSGCQLCIGDTKRTGTPEDRPGQQGYGIGGMEMAKKKSI